MFLSKGRSGTLRALRSRVAGLGFFGLVGLIVISGRGATVGVAVLAGLEEAAGAATSADSVVAVAEALGLGVGS